MKDGSGNGTSLSVGAVRGESEERSPLLETPKDMLSKALEMDSCFLRVPVLGNMWGRSFPRAFERWVQFIFVRITFMKNSRGMQKKALATGNNLHKAPVGKPGVGSFSGTF